MIYTAYLEQLLEPVYLQEEVEKAARILLPRWEAGDFHCMACTGASGVGFASALSFRTGIPMLLVRKPDENSHSAFPREGYFPPPGVRARVLFVDDMIVSGATFVRVREALEVGKYPGEIVGTYLYRNRYHSMGVPSFNVPAPRDPGSIPWAHGRGAL